MDFKMSVLSDALSDDLSNGTLTYSDKSESQVSKITNIIQIDQNYSYDQQQFLGGGAYSKVYKGFDKKNNRIIAVKIIRKGWGIQKVIQRQLQALQTLSKYQHPNIMSFYGHTKKQNQTFLFLQYCRESILQKQLNDQKFSELTVLKLFKQILDAMTYMHSLGQIHRDLKPANILLDESGNIKIADFGQTRNQGVDMTVCQGTKLYMAPEAFHQQQVYDQKRDVWSVGLILYELLMAKKLYGEIQTVPQVKRQIQKLKNGTKATYPQEYHSKWQYFTNKMLIYKKQQRPSFVELLKQFNQSYKKMLQDIALKTGQNPEEYEPQLKLKTVSPYISAAIQQGIKCMLLKLKEQRSYKRIINLKAYNKFFTQKLKFYSELIKLINRVQCPYMEPVYQHMLMYLSGAMCIALQQQKLNQMKHKMIVTPEQSLSVKKFNEIHQGQFLEIIANTLQQNKSQIQKRKSIISKLIITKLLEDYLTRPKERKILQEAKNIIELLKRSKDSQYTFHDDYLMLYKQIIKSPKVYKTRQQLLKFPDQDVKTYMYIRILGDIDKVFLEQKYKDGDYMTLRKKEIQNMDKNMMIEFIENINNK